MALQYPAGVHLQPDERHHLMSFFQPTPEQEAEMELARQAHEMAVQAHFHDLMGFWDTLSKEQARSALAVLAHIMNDHETVRHFRGYLVGIMERKWGICAACGVDHAAEIAATPPEEGGDGAEASGDLG